MASVNLPLEPDSKARNETGVIGRMAVLFPESRCLSEGAFAHDADVGRKLATDLIAQPQAKFPGAQAGANSPRRVVFSVELRLEQWLQNQPIGEQRLVLNFNPGRGLSRLADISGCFDFELVGRKPDHADS